MEGMLDMGNVACQSKDIDELSPAQMLCTTWRSNVRGNTHTVTFATGTYCLLLARQKLTCSTATLECHCRVEEPRMQCSCSVNVLFATNSEVRATKSPQESSFTESLALGKDHTSKLDLYGESQAAGLERD